MLSFFSLTLPAHAGALRIFLFVAGLALATAGCAPPEENLSPTGPTPAPGPDAPAVVSVTPENGATGVGLLSPVSVNFSRAMDPATVEAAFGLTPATEGAPGWDAENTSFSFVPAAGLAAETLYAASVGGGAAGVSGETLGSTYTFSFSTGSAPAVSATIPKAGAVGVSPAIAITVTFSQAMDAPTTEAAFALTPAVAGAFSWSADGLTLVFTPGTLLGQGATYMVNVGGGAMDLAGSPLASPASFSFTTNTTPQVASWAPASPTGVALNSGIAIHFTKPMNPTVTQAAFSLTPSVAGTPSWSANNTTLFFTPGANLAASTMYTVAVGTVATDAGGTPLPAEFSFSFTTGAAADNTVPVLNTVSPANGSMGVPAGATMVLTFSEPMKASSVETAFAVNPTVTGGFSWSSDFTALTFTPTTPLGYSAGYSISLSVGALDLAGNPLGAQGPFAFSTEADSYPPTVATTSPQNHATGVAVGAAVAVTFSEPMSTGTVEAAFGVSPATAGTFVWSVGDTVVTFTPGASLTRSATYTVTVGTGAQDKAGNALGAAYGFDFTIAPPACGELVNGRTYCASWDYIQATIFAGSGGCTFCHYAPLGRGPSGLILEADQYAAIVTNGWSSGYLGAGNIIVPGSKATSFLYRKITGELVFGEGGTMPYLGVPLSAADIALVGTWIDEGANKSEP